MESRPISCVHFVTGIFQLILWMVVIACTLSPVSVTGSSSSYDVTSGNLWLSASSPLAKLIKSSHFGETQRKPLTSRVNGQDDSFLQDALLEMDDPSAATEMDRLEEQDFLLALAQSLDSEDTRLLQEETEDMPSYSHLSEPSSIQDPPMASKRGYYLSRYYPALLKRSSLNELIRRLEAKSGKRPKTGRAHTIRFGMGGRK